MNTQSSSLYLHRYGCTSVACSSSWSFITASVMFGSLGSEKALHAITAANCRTALSDAMYPFGAKYTGGSGRSSVPSAAGLRCWIAPERTFL